METSAEVTFSNDDQVPLEKKAAEADFNLSRWEQLNSKLLDVRQNIVGEGTTFGYIFILTVYIHVVLTLMFNLYLHYNEFTNIEYPRFRYFGMASMSNAEVIFGTTMFYSFMHALSCFFMILFAHRTVRLFHSESINYFNTVIFCSP